MRKQLRSLQLNDEHHSYLTNLLAKWTLNARVARRASALLQLHRGLELNKIADSLGVVYQTVAMWRDQYFESGLDFLSDKPRPVLCYDEEAYFLIGDIVEDVPVREGQIARELYPHEKFGSCSFRLKRHEKSSIGIIKKWMRNMPNIRKLTKKQTI